MAQYAEESYIKMVEHQQGQDPADSRLWVKFFFQPLQNESKSAAEGRPIYDEVEYISIMVPGDKDNIVERPCNDFDRARFSKQYAHWKSTGAVAVEGTPLEAWPSVTRSQVMELKHFGVNTVEALAALSDANAMKFMGIQALKQKAQAFLDAAKGNVSEKYEAELAKKTDEINALKQAVKEQSDKIDALLKSQRR